MKWAEDKKKHFYTAISAGYILEILITIAFFMTNYNELALKGVSDAITLIVGVISILGWEFFPEWFPKIFPDRTFSEEDMYAGLAGLGIAIFSFRISFILLSILVFKG